MSERAKASHPQGPGFHAVWLARTIWVLVSIMGVAVCWLNRQPVYQGKNAAEWLREGLAGQTNIEVVGNVFVQFGDAGISYLVRKLTAEEPRWRQVLIQLNNGFGASIGFKPISPSTDENQRLLARRLLGYFEGRAAPRLLEAVGNRSPEARAEAIRAMGELGPTAAALVGPTLTNLLSDPSVEVTYEAITSLAALHYSPQVVVPLLLPLLQHTNTRVRVEASYALGTYPPAPESTLVPLKHALADPDSVVRANATRALGKIGPPAASVLEMLEVQLKDVPLPAARALEAIAFIANALPEDAREDYLTTQTNLLHTGESYFRLMIVRAKVHLGSPPDDLQPICQELVHDSRNWACWEAMEAILELQPSPDWVRPLLNQASKHPNGLVRQMAARVPDSASSSAITR